MKTQNGLPAPTHKASPRDLLLLSTQAMRQPLFRKIVGTVQHGCTVEGPGGKRRNLVWKSSNRLLRTEGYNGIKTGTTPPAGSCLVSHGTRDKESLIVVVLGSSSTDARYTDTRNLYRWAWQQLAKINDQKGHHNAYKASIFATNVGYGIKSTYSHTLFSWKGK